MIFVATITHGNAVQQAHIVSEQEFHTEFAAKMYGMMSVGEIWDRSVRDGSEHWWKVRRVECQ